MLLTPGVRRILVLDDDQVMRDLLQALLSLEGCSVTPVSSGREALQHLGTDPAFDLVLTDVQMPGLEGYALAKALRLAMPKSALLVGMSGTEPSQDTRDAFDAFVFKPFDLQLLRDAVAIANARREAGEGLAKAGGDTEASAPATRIAPLDEKIFGSLNTMIAAPQLRNLFSMALIDIEKRHKRIVDAAAEDDLATVHSQAHAIKGSCGMIGASELQNLAATIEEGASPDRVAIEEIPRACVRLQGMLNSLLHPV